MFSHFLVVEQQPPQIPASYRLRFLYHLLHSSYTSGGSLITKDTRSSALSCGIGPQLAQEDRPVGPVQRELWLPRSRRVGLRSIWLPLSPSPPVPYFFCGGSRWVSSPSGPCLASPARGTSALWPVVAVRLCDTGEHGRYYGTFHVVTSFLVALTIPVAEHVFEGGRKGP